MPAALRRAVGRLFGRHRRPTPEAVPETKPDPVVASRAGTVVGRYAEEHATLLERAERLAAKARRLEEAGTPSESANNRAARAVEAVETGLVALRDAFVASDGREGGEAFDREVSRRLAALRTQGQST